MLRPRQWWSCTCIFLWFGCSTLSLSESFEFLRRTKCCFPVAEPEHLTLSKRARILYGSEGECSTYGSCDQLELSDRQPIGNSRTRRLCRHFRPRRRPHQMRCPELCSGCPHLHKILLSSIQRIRPAQSTGTFRQSCSTIKQALVPDHFLKTRDFSSPGLLWFPPSVSATLLSTFLAKCRGVRARASAPTLQLCAAPPPVLALQFSVSIVKSSTLPSDSCSDLQRKYSFQSSCCLYIPKRVNLWCVLLLSVTSARLDTEPQFNTG